MDAINEKAKMLKQDIDTLLSWDSQEKVAQMVKEQVGNKDHSIGCAIGFGSLKGILYNIHNVTSIKEDALPALRAFRKEGFKYVRHGDYEEIGRRSYYLKNADDKKIILNVFMETSEKGESTDQCKFVKIGEETSPVYKLVCPDSVQDEIEVPA